MNVYRLKITDSATGDITLMDVRAQSADQAIQVAEIHPSFPLDAHVSCKLWRPDNERPEVIWVSHQPQGPITS